MYKLFFLLLMNILFLAGCNKDNKINRISEEEFRDRLIHRRITISLPTVDRKKNIKIYAMAEQEVKVFYENLNSKVSDPKYIWGSNVEKVLAILKNYEWLNNRPVTSSVVLDIFGEPDDANRIDYLFNNSCQVDLSMPVYSLVYKELGVELEFNAMGSVLWAFPINTEISHGSRVGLGALHWAFTFEYSEATILTGDIKDEVVLEVISFASNLTIDQGKNNTIYPYVMAAGISKYISKDTSLNLIWVDEINEETIRLNICLEGRFKIPLDILVKKQESSWIVDVNNCFLIPSQ